MTNAILEALGLVTLRVCVILVPILVASRVLGARQAAWRSLLWRLGLGGALLIPLSLAVTPRWKLPLASPIPLSSPAAVGPPEIVVRLPAAQAHAAPPPVRAGRYPTDVTVPAVRLDVARDARVLVLTLGQILSLVYVAGVTILLLRSMSAWYGMRRLGASVTEIRADGELQRLHALSERLGIRQAVKLATSDSVSCPTLLGVLSPIIVLPRQPNSSYPQDGVLLHELAHVRLRSVLVNLAARVALALNWYNPLVWMAVRAERLAGEQVCDDWATALSQDWRGYTDALLEAAASLGALRPSVAAVHFVRPAGLASRLTRIRQLQGHAAPKTGAVRRFLTIALSLTCLGILATSGLQVVATTLPPVDLTAHAERWEFVWLPSGVLVGGWGHAMNDDGHVAGECVDGNVSQSCRWSPDTTEPVVVGTVRSRASAISSEGIVVGIADTDDMTLAIPYLWQDGELTLMPTLGGPQTTIFDVNSRGQAVGWAHRPDSTTVAFVAWADSIMELPSFGGQHGMALAITEDGGIVGGSDHEDYTSAPFYWHPDSGLQELWYPPRFTGGSARDITEEDHVLVDLHQCDWGEEWDSQDCRVLGRPFLWTFSDRANPDGQRLGQYAPLPTPTGYDDIRGRALNSRGDVLLQARNRQTADGDWADFLIADGQLVSLPQPEGAGRMRYRALNGRGWLAGNLTLPQRDENGEVLAKLTVGFIAKPRRE